MIRMRKPRSVFFSEKYAEMNAEQATTLQAVLFVLLQVNQADLGTVVKALSPEERDTLMKYVYRGMESPAEGPQGNSQCAALLQWHARIVEVSGVGAIVRSMSDRRQGGCSPKCD